MTTPSDPPELPSTPPLASSQAGSPTGSSYPEKSNSTLALVLGILGLLVCCGLTGPFAWWVGATEVTAIDEGRRPPMNRGSAKAGMILGIIGTCLAGPVWIFLFFGGLSMLTTLFGALTALFGAIGM